MNSSPSRRHTDVTSQLVNAAQAGDHAAFTALVEPHRRELHIHSYRMLGSHEDAEDAVQDTLLRAWTRISTYSGASTFRAWLYGIATNACLDQLRRRKSRVWPTEVSVATDPRLDPAQPQDLPWLEPYPTALLAAAGMVDPGPEVMYTSKETIELAFLAAIQHLPPRQRAVLILRDVLDWSAKDVASTLDTTPTAVNSALQRAHATLAARMPDRGSWPRRSTADERVLLDRLIIAWEQADADALVELLAPDTRYVMPPRPTWYSGRTDVEAFFRHHVFGQLDADWRLVPTGANHQPAFGLYMRPRSQSAFHPFGVGVMQLSPEGIKEIAMFNSPTLFELFALPPSA